MEFDAQGRGAGFQGGEAFVEGEDDGVVAARGGGDGVLDGDGRFAGAGGADQQRAGAAVGPAAQERVERGHAALDAFVLERFAMFRRDESRKDDEPAFADRKIVVAAAEAAAAELHDAQAAAFGTVDGSELLQRDHAVGDAVELEVGSFRGAVVEQEDGALAADEELLERENLAAIAERVLREQPELGERIEDDAGRIDFFDRSRGPSRWFRSARPPTGDTSSPAIRRRGRIPPK